MPSVDVVAIYLRISKDPLQLKAGVGRQRRDCTRMAELRWPGARVVEYVDNDISASRYSRKPRPAFKRLCDDMTSGAVGAVVGWDFDRVFRQPRELEAYLDLCDRLKFTRVVTAQGDIDLTTDNGRLYARIMVAVAAKESDDKSRRIKRAYQDRRERGLHQGTSRIVYGYKLRGRTPVVVPEQAAVVREVAQRVLAGEPIQSVGRWLRAEHPDAPGSGSGIRSMLLSPTLVALNTAGVHGDWEPILDGTTYAELRALLLNPERIRRAPSGERRWWLSGLVFCAVCGTGMVISSNGRRLRSYRCDGVNGRGCGGVSISARPLHQLIENVIVEVAEFERPQMPVIQVNVDDDRLAELAAMYAAGELTRAEWVAARERVQHASRETRVEARRTTQMDAGQGHGSQDRGRGNQGGCGGPSAPRWGNLDVHQRHAVAATLIRRVHVGRSSARGRWDSSRVSVEWCR